jgi:IclR family KDG regulon transcriptional repressor
MAVEGMSRDGLPGTTQRRVRAVEHAVDVMEYMAAAGRPVGVSEIARGTSLNKATTHHILSTLVARRFARQDPHTLLYQLGWNLYELGSSVARDSDLTRVARPYLDQLALQASTTVLLGILDEDSVLYVDRGEAGSGLQMVANAGRRSPLHATASGKLLLAFADRDVLERVLAQRLEQLTRTTITDPATLRRQLAHIRATGYATCWQEREVGLCSVSVPLHNYTHRVVACLTLAASSARLNSESLDEYLLPLRRTAVQIEGQLGADRDPSEVGEAY